MFNKRNWSRLKFFFFFFNFLFLWLLILPRMQLSPLWLSSKSRSALPFSVHCFSRLDIFFFALLFFSFSLSRISNTIDHRFKIISFEFLFFESIFFFIQRIMNRCVGVYVCVCVCEFRPMAIEPPTSSCTIITFIAFH